MKDPSAAWRVPFSARAFPASAKAARWITQNQHDAWLALRVAEQDADKGPRHRHMYAVALLAAGLPFTAWDELWTAENDASRASGGQRDDPMVRAIRADFATASARCGLGDLALRQLTQAIQCRQGPEDEWAEINRRGQELTNALHKRDQERSLHLLRAARFADLTKRGEAGSLHRLEHAKSLLALGDLDHAMAHYDAGEDVLVSLGDDEEYGVAALELLVGVHLRAGARDRELRERARKRLHRVRPNSAVLQKGAHPEDGRRMLHDMEMRKATVVLRFLADEVPDAAMSQACLNHLFLLARANPDQPICAMAAALAHLDRGEHAKAQAALDFTGGPLGDGDCTYLTSRGLTVAPSARVRKTAR